VINGVVAVPVMALLMLISSNRRIMGGFAITRLWWFIGWAATAVMAAATVGFVVSMI